MFIALLQMAGSFDSMDYIIPWLDREPCSLPVNKCKTFNICIIVSATKMQRRCLLWQAVQNSFHHWVTVLARNWIYLHSPLSSHLSLNFTSLPRSATSLSPSELQPSWRIPALLSCHHVSPQHMKSTHSLQFYIGWFGVSVAKWAPNPHLS